MTNTGSIFYPDREKMLTQLTATEEFDFVICGGGSTGTATAMRLAQEGYTVALFEGRDFAKGTAGRNSNLIHGGLRYFRQRKFSLVFEALHARNEFKKDAPDMVSELPFVIPNYSWFKQLKFWVGLKGYDLLSGWTSNFPRSRWLSADEAVRWAPGLRRKGLKGAVLYYDGQFVDAHLTYAMARAAARNNAVVLNHMEVTNFLFADDQLNGVVVRDTETGEIRNARAKVIIAAGGPFNDAILGLGKKNHEPTIGAARGVHIVLPKRFMRGVAALTFIPTSDDRVLFVIPWLGALLVGTTDKPVESIDFDPTPPPEDTKYILEELAPYLDETPTEDDIQSITIGLRPLPIPKPGQTTAQVSRDFSVEKLPNGLVVMSGGKFTTSQLMSDAASTKCKRWFNLKTPQPRPKFKIELNRRELLNKVLAKEFSLGQSLIASRPETWADVVVAVRYELARTVEDVLARRLKVLSIDARAAIEMAPIVAAIIAKELGFGEEWQTRQVSEFTNLAFKYLPRKTA